MIITTLTFVMCSTGAPQVSPEVMLQTGCTDCMVIYINNYVHGFPLLMLLSKRKPWFPSPSGDFLNVSMCKSIQVVWITLLVQLTANWGCAEHAVVEVDDDIPLVKQIGRWIERYCTLDWFHNAFIFDVSFLAQVKDRQCLRPSWLSLTPRQSVLVGPNPLSLAQIMVMARYPRKQRNSERWRWKTTASVMLYLCFSPVHRLWKLPGIWRGP